MEGLMKANAVLTSPICVTCRFLIFRISLSTLPWRWVGPFYPEKFKYVDSKNKFSGFPVLFSPGSNLFLIRPPQWHKNLRWG